MVKSGRGGKNKRKEDMVKSMFQYPLYPIFLM